MTNLQLTLNQTESGVAFANVLNFQAPNNANQTIQELVDGIRFQWDFASVSSFSDTWFLNSVLVREWDGGSPFSTLFSFNLGPLQGTSIVEALPRQNSLLVSTAFNGPRPNRGRIYFGGLAENAWDGDQWDAATITDLQAMVQSFISGIPTSAGSCFLRIARLDPVSNTWVLDNPAENAIVRPYAGTQRRRRT